jgi:hypothetical protein
MRRMVGTMTFGLALILPAVVASQQESDTVAAATAPLAEVCAADSSRHLTAVNAEHVWRLRAYDDLDCALAILDDALMTHGSAIMLPRQAAEHARARVWSARDAAARIGR